MIFRTKKPKLKISGLAILIEVYNFGQSQSTE